MHEPSVVADDTIGAHQHVVGDGVAEHFDAESVCNNLFCFLVQIGMDDRHVVVAGYAVSKG